MSALDDRSDGGGITIIRRAPLAKALGMSEQTIRRRVECGEFPQPIQIGPRMIGWRVEAVRDWLDARPVGDLPPAIKRGSGRPK